MSKGVDPTLKQQAPSPSTSIYIQSPIFMASTPGLTVHQLPQPVSTVYGASASSQQYSDVQQVWITYGFQALWKFKLNDLKNELKSKGVTVVGNKPTIINKLHEVYMSELSNAQLSPPQITKSSSSSRASKEQDSLCEITRSSHNKETEKQKVSPTGFKLPSFLSAQSFQPSSSAAVTTAGIFQPSIPNMETLTEGNRTMKNSLAFSPSAHQVDSSNKLPESGKSNDNKAAMAPSKKSMPPARKKVEAQKGTPNNAPSSKPELSASASVLMQISGAPSSPKAPRTLLSTLRSKPPPITIPKLMTSSSEQSIYNTFSPHSSLHSSLFSPSSKSKNKKVAKKKASSKPTSAIPSTSVAADKSAPDSSGTTPQNKSSKPKVKKQEDVPNNEKQPKRRGRPPKNRNSSPSSPSDNYTTPTLKRSSFLKRANNNRSKSSKNNRETAAIEEMRSPVQLVEDSMTSDLTSESEFDYIDSYFDNEINFGISSSETPFYRDVLENEPLFSSKNVEDFVEKSTTISLKRAFAEDEFYDANQILETSSTKRRRSDSCEVFDENSPLFMCTTVQEVPESILESALSEKTMGACQPEYYFEVTLIKNKSLDSTTNLFSQMMDEDLEKRKLSVGGSISLHELTKAVLELFAYDRLGDENASLGVDSDSYYKMCLPFGLEVYNPEASSQVKISADTVNVASANLDTNDNFVISFPCQNDSTKNYCEFVIRVEKISITSSNDDLLLNDEDQELNMQFIADSYLNSTYEGDNDDDDNNDGPSEDDNDAHSEEDVHGMVFDDNFLISI